MLKLILMPEIGSPRHANCDSPSALAARIKLHGDLRQLHRRLIVRQNTNTISRPSFYRHAMGNVTRSTGACRAPAQQWSKRPDCNARGRACATIGTCSNQNTIARQSNAAQTPATHQQALQQVSFFCAPRPAGAKNQMRLPMDFWQHGQHARKKLSVKIYYANDGREHQARPLKHCQRARARRILSQRG